MIAIPRDLPKRLLTLRSLSEATRLLLERLRGVWSGGRSRSSDQEVAAILQEIGEAREPEAVPSLLPFLSGFPPQVEQAAARAIDRVVSGCDPLSLAQLDGTVRRITDWHWPILRAHEVLPLSRGFTGTLGVLSFNASGHAREAAVRALADVRDGRELPFLLIRLNDWVALVRDVARRALYERIRPAYANHFVASLPLVYRLQRQSRQDHGPVFDSVMGLLRSEDCRPALREAMTSGERDFRRLAFRLLVSGGGDDQLAVLAEGLASSDTVMRLWAARELRARLEGDALRAALHQLKQDRFMPIRREALYGFVERLPEAAEAELHSALLDPHPSLREAARFFLRQSGEQQFASFYRERLVDAEGIKLQVAVAGLGEAGVTRDAALLAAYFKHTNPRVRRASVRAVARLDAESHVKPFLTAVQDPVASVAREAGDAVRPHLYLVAPARLWAIFNSNPQRHVRRVALRLTADLQWWNAAPMLLVASGCDDDAISALARDFLRRWMRNVHRLSGVRPTDEQLQSLDEALSQHGAGLDRVVRDDLASLLSYAKRQAV